MNTSAPASPAPSAGHATTHQAHGTAAKERKPGGQPAAGGDLFAQLLLLLSAGTDGASAPLNTTADGLPGSTADTPTSADDPPQPLVADTTPSQTNPLLNLLGWNATPAPLLASPLATGAGGAGAALGALAAATGQASAGTSANGLTSPSAGPSFDRPATLATGLQPLNAVESADADTLIAMGLPTPAAAAAAADNALNSNTSPQAPGAAQARHPGDGRSPLGVHVTAWRSTTTLAHAASSHSAASTGATTAALAERGSAALPSHSPNSGLPLADVRTAMANGSSTATDPDTDLEARPGLTGISGRSALHSESGALPTEAGAAASGQGSEGGDHNASAHDGPTSDDAQPSPYSAPTDADDAASAPWGAQHLRHASLRVGDAGDSAIDIQLSMAGQELQVAFRTDDEQTRTQLAQDAGNALGELLQRSGIELGGVSVGGQGAQAGHDPAGRAPQPPQTPRADARVPHPLAGAAASRSAATPRPRDDGSQPLDLFV